MDTAGKVASGVSSVVEHSNVRTGCALPEYATPWIHSFWTLSRLTTESSLQPTVHNQALKF